MALAFFRGAYREDPNNPFYFAHRLLFCFGRESAQLRVEILLWLYHPPHLFPDHSNRALLILSTSCARLFLFVDAWLTVPTPSVAGSDSETDDAR